MNNMWTNKEIFIKIAKKALEDVNAERHRPADTLNTMGKLRIAAGNPTYTTDDLEIAS